MINKKDFLGLYLEEAPLPHAIIRSIECDIFYRNKEYIKHPIVDYGCGDGLFSSVLFNDAIDVGVDLSSSELELAKKRSIYKTLFL
ncbi:hypothetical protein HGB13_02415 [bacterium]|nr:hypothetical protein [bacterium]